MMRWLPTRAQARRAAWQLAIPLTFLVFIYLIYPFWDFFEFDADEGTNLMKARLLAQGYPLYKSIWSDQPPLLTYILSWVGQLLGWRVGMARFAVACLSSLLLWSAWLFLRTAGGRAHAWAGFLLVAMVPYYLRLSVSVMIGLPAIAFGMASLACLAGWHRTGRRTWLSLSALSLGMAVLTKLVIGLLAPIFGLGLILAAGKDGTDSLQEWRWRLGPALGWSVIFTLVVAGGLWLTAGPAYLSQLLDTHLAAPSAPGLETLDILDAELSKSRLNLVLGGVGLALALRKRCGLMAYPLIWTGVFYLFLKSYAPIWYHHQLFISIPIALLSAYAVGELVDAATEQLRAARLLSAAVAVSPLVLLGALSLVTTWMPIPFDRTSLPSFHDKLYRRVPDHDYRLLNAVAEHAPETRVVVTDRPMFAFRAGLLVPPELAVISGKRLATGALAGNEMLAILQRERPEQVLLTRYSWPDVEAHLEQHYSLTYAEGKRKLYVRREILP